MHIFSDYMILKADIRDVLWNGRHKNSMEKWKDMVISFILPSLPLISVLVDKTQDHTEK